MGFVMPEIRYTVRFPGNNRGQPAISRVHCVWQILNLFWQYKAFLAVGIMTITYSVAFLVPRLLLSHARKAPDMVDNAGLKKHFTKIADKISSLRTPLYMSWCFAGTRAMMVSLFHGGFRLNMQSCVNCHCQAIYLPTALPSEAGLTGVHILSLYSQDRSLQVCRKASKYLIYSILYHLFINIYSRRSLVWEMLRR